MPLDFKDTEDQLRVRLAMVQDSLARPAYDPGKEWDIERDRLQREEQLILNRLRRGWFKKGE